MHYGLLIVGLLSGGTAAVAAFELGAGMAVAILCYAAFGFGAVSFAAVIWAMVPQNTPALVPPRAVTPPYLRLPGSPDR